MEAQNFDIKKIMELLPHRYPFLLVDRVLEVVPGEKAVGLKNVTMNEPFFQGHFPGEPLMPGVLQIEALAQVGALAVLTMPEYKNNLLLFAGVEKFRFKKLVQPGDQLIMEVEVSNIRRSVGKGKGSIKIEDKVVTSGELLFSVVPKADYNAGE